eukprot:11849629-Alexandrium_andersonii.AAC.1
MPRRLVVVDPVYHAVLRKRGVRRRSEGDAHGSDLASIGGLIFSCQYASPSAKHASIIPNCHAPGSERLASAP